MQRIAIIGICGAGKSTLAKALGARLNLPVVHLDQHYWGPGWTHPADIEQRHNNIRDIIAGDQWVIDGNWNTTFKERFTAADIIIYLDFPTRIALYRVIKRAIRSYGKVRDDGPKECPERFHWDFIKYVWTYNKNYRHLFEKIFVDYDVRHKVLTLKNPVAVKEFQLSMQRMPDHNF
ncbi:MAG: AAA family ATPase [Oligoflexales bacterium]